MNIQTALKGALVAMALAVLVIACDRQHPTPLDSTGPSEITPVPSAGPTAPTITVELSGPAQLAPGDSAQYTLIVHSSDLVSRTPTNIRWTAAPPAFLQVDSSGRVTAGPSAGGANVSAEMTIDGPGGGKKWALLEVLVVPDGTFRIVGTITDSESPASPVSGALVEVTPGGLVATTGPDGFYRLYGVPAEADFRVTAVGYEPRVQHLQLSSHVTRNFALTLSEPHLNLTGNYTLAIDVTDGCSGLPADLQHRRYDATITQTGLTVDVVLTERLFSVNAGHGDRFRGHVDPTGVTFTLGQYEAPWDWGMKPVYPDLAELLPNRTYLVASGTAVTTGSAAGLSGVLADGALENFDSTFPNAAFSLGVCSRPRFTLTPR
jgi:hypothetical protein